MTTNDSPAVVPDIAALLDVCAALGLMMLCTDADLVIEQTTPAFTDYLDRPLAGCALTQAIPALGGLEEELGSIARRQSPFWRIPGLSLSNRRLSHCEVIFLPRGDAVGLTVAARRMQTEVMVEQTLRQQRNELTLLQDKLTRQAAALRTANERLASLDRERQDLLHLIIRDIKSALTIVGGYTEWLWQDVQTLARPEHATMFPAVAAGIERMNAMVEEVQAVERIEQALAEVHWRRVEMPAAVAQATAMHRSKAALRKITLSVTAADYLPPIFGSPDLLQEAISDLLAHGMAAAARGSTIELSLSVWDRWLLTRLEYQVAAGPRGDAAAPEAGSGLRLARARLIAEGHGGHLAVDEEKARTRRLSLWLLLGERPNIPAPSPPPAEAGAPAGTEQPASELIIAGESNIRIHTATQRVWAHDVLLTLSASEYRLLLHLAEHADRVVTHNQLLDVIWTYDSEVTLDNLRVLVWRLRQKLRAPQAGAEYLRTVRGFGYMLVG